MKKSKLMYHGRPVFHDERNQMFVEAGKSRIYLNGETVKKLEEEGRKRKKKKIVDESMTKKEEKAKKKRITKKKKG